MKDNRDNEIINHILLKLEENRGETFYEIFNTVVGDSEDYSEIIAAANRIKKIMLFHGLIEEVDYYDYIDCKITGYGLTVNQNGGWIAHLEYEKHKVDKENKKHKFEIIHKIFTGVMILLTCILGYMQYIKTSEVQQLEIENQKLNQQIQSLKTTNEELAKENDKQVILIDSLVNIK